MTNALIVYGSTTGNTESVAEKIADVLRDKGMAVTVKNVTAVSVSELGGDNDLTVLGSSTWGDEDIEFQEDFAELYEHLGDAALHGKNVAIFGCGDSAYTHFCGAVDLLEESMEKLKANVVIGSLRIDGDPSDAGDEIHAWAEDLADKA
ncbi:MAG: flavodoxin [Desulfobulbaceae bacterium]|nr:flavodoxin [Desulfobulbaceae bacterium]